MVCAEVILRWISVIARFNEERCKIVAPSYLLSWRPAAAESGAGKVKVVVRARRDWGWEATCKDPLLFFFSLHFLKFHGSIVDLQCCNDFCCIIKWFSYTCTHLHFSSDSFPEQILTDHWGEGPVLYSRSLLASRPIHLTVPMASPTARGSSWARDWTQATAVTTWNP